ncbi:hypothetical protein IFR05_015166 [Cadophora sp. M221]|nr:hypothetical protein IFR05_015166 [Cadophora sp. M221]
MYVSHHPSTSRLYQLSPHSILFTISDSSTCCSSTLQSSAKKNEMDSEKINVAMTEDTKNQQGEAVRVRLQPWRKLDISDPASFLPSSTGTESSGEYEGKFRAIQTNLVNSLGNPKGRGG